MELIEISSLFERKELDMEGIQECLRETLRNLDNEENLSGHDSRIMNEICEKCTNQNWTLAEENDVLAFISQIQDFLLKYRKDISSYYFYDFCSLLCSISRMGTPMEKNKITTFFIEHYIKNPLEPVGKKERYVDGPLNAFHFDLGVINLISKGIAEVLLNGITQISKSDYSVCMYWIQDRLVEDQGFLCYVAVMLYSYVYFTKEAEIKMLALANLMYIRGHLEGEGRFVDSKRKYVCNAIEHLKKMKEWFGDETYKTLLQKDEQYRKLFFNVVEEWK